MNVLIVDDNPQARELLRRHLEPHDVRVQEAADRPSAVQRVRKAKFDAVFIDWVLRPWTQGESAGNGIDVCREVRRAGETAPIWMYSAVARTGQALILALEAGADEFIESPLENIDQFVARVHAMMRRRGWDHGAEPPPPPVAIGDIVLDRKSRVVNVSGCAVQLSLSEFELLAYLAARKRRSVSHDELFRNVLRAPTLRADNSNALAMLVQRLRTKLGSAGAAIENVRGFGYRLSGHAVETVSLGPASGPPGSLSSPPGALGDTPKPPGSPSEPPLPRSPVPSS